MSGKSFIGKVVDDDTGEVGPRVKYPVRTPEEKRQALHRQKAWPSKFARIEMQMIDLILEMGDDLPKTQLYVMLYLLRHTTETSNNWAEIKSQAEMARVIHRSASEVSRALRQLERRGWIRRKTPTLIWIDMDLAWNGSNYDRLELAHSLGREPNEHLHEWLRDQVKAV